MVGDSPSPRAVKDLAFGSVSGSASFGVRVSTQFGSDCGNGIKSFRAPVRSHKSTVASASARLPGQVQWAHRLSLQDMEE